MEQKTIKNLIEVVVTSVNVLEKNQSIKTDNVFCYHDTNFVIGEYKGVYFKMTKVGETYKFDIIKKKENKGCEVVKLEVDSNKNINKANFNYYNPISSLGLYYNSLVNKITNFKYMKNAR